MSEKPFWEGKTCKEMERLRVRVTLINGDIITGRMDAFGYITLSVGTVLVSNNGSSEPFVPRQGIKSVELLDESKYERIDSIENVREGDIFVAKSGNLYDIRTCEKRRGTFVFLLSMESEATEWISSRSFAYALRRKPKLPDHDGLWWDKDNALWSVAISGLDNSKLVALLIGDPESPVTGSVWSGLNSKHVTSQAPFRPAKAVEA